MILFNIMECSHSFINLNTVEKVCKLCGVVKTNREMKYKENDEFQFEFSNIVEKFFSPTTYMTVSNSKNRHIVRTHIWYSNNNSKNFLNKCYKDIMELFETYGIDKCYTNSVCNEMNSYYR